MLTLLHILEPLLPLLYVATLAVYARHFVIAEDEPGAQASFGGFAMLAITLGIHVGYTFMRGVAFDALPLASKAEFLSLIALSIMSVYAVLERGAKDAHTGAFFLGIALPFQILASVWMEDTDKQQMLLEHPSLQNPIYGVHAVTLVLALAALTVGAVHALMYLMLARQLKSRELGLVFKRLPPLRTLEQMSARGTIAGIVLLGVGLILGHVVAWSLRLDINLFDPKIVSMDLAWLVYVIGLVIVRVRGVSGRRAAQLAVAGFVALFALIGVTNLALTSFHAFH